MEMNCLKSHNVCVNTLVLPGSLAKSSYHPNDYPYDSNIDALKLLFIPLDNADAVFIGCSPYPQYIPVLLKIAANNSGSLFCIHFHGNACDIGEVSACAEAECYTYMSHYMIVEYPQFGIAKGFPSEAVIDAIARCVHRFVVNELKIPKERIVLLGRSIGTGPACSLASYLTELNTPPAALILHAPYTSLHDASYDLLGCFSFLFLNRWENWKKLCRVKKKDAENDFRDPEHINSSTGPKSPSNKNPLLPVGQNSISPQPTPSLRKGGKELTSYAPQASPSLRKSGKEVPACIPKKEYSDPSSERVVTCPVLFIHADRDLIIDIHHSQTMHDLRTAAGLPSKLFIQESVEGFKKGHNFFDYGQEVILPTRDFLNQNTPYAQPHAVNLDRVRTACTVPPEFIFMSSESDPSHRDSMHSPRSNKNNKNNMNSNSNSSNTDSNGHMATHRMERDKPDGRNVTDDFNTNPPDSCIYSTSTHCRWMMCPCVFCSEASVACVLTCFKNLYHSVTCTSAQFVYETKRMRNKEHSNGCKVLKALLCCQSLESFVREEEPLLDNSDSDEESVDPATFNPLNKSPSPRSEGNANVQNTKTIELVVKDARETAMEHHMRIEGRGREGGTRKVAGASGNKMDVYQKLQIQSDVRTSRPALLRTVTESSMVEKPISRNVRRNQSEKIRRFSEDKDGDEEEVKEEDGGGDIDGGTNVTREKSVKEDRAKGNVTSPTHAQLSKAKGWSSYKEWKDVSKGKYDEDARTV